MNDSRVPRLLLVVSCFFAQQAAGQVTVSFDEPHQSVTMAVPDSPLALQIDLLHLKLEQNQLDKSATRRKLQASDTHGWELTAFVYPLPKKQTSAELNEESFGGLRQAAVEAGFKIEGMKTSERGEFSIREYMIPEFRGRPVRQKNVFGYATSGDFGVDFHISKLSYSPVDDTFVNSLINGIHLLKDYSPDSTTEFGFGSIYYLRQDWAKAAAHYERALQLEKQKR